MANFPVLRRIAAVGVVIVMVLVAIGTLPTAFGDSSPSKGAGIEGTPFFMPVMIRDLTPTPSPTATTPPTPTISPIPQFVKNVPLDTQCPNAVGFNANSGYVYVANNFSYNVSVFQNSNFITNITVGEWPTIIAPDNDSAVTYVTVLHGSVNVLDGTNNLGTVPKHYEPYGAVVNPVNGYTYVTDLDSTIQVINGTQLITDIWVTDPETNGGAGWLQPILVDPNTGLIYFASWSHGKMYVMDGTTVVASYRAGWGVKDMEIDAERGFIYIAHDDPNATYPHDISVFNINTGTMQFIDTAEPMSRDVAVDPISGVAYFTHSDSDKVTAVIGTQVIGTMDAGDRPWGVGVNPNTGYAFVANRDGNSISVYHNAVPVTTIPANGLAPFAVGVDTINNDVYIANRGDEYGLFQCRQASVTILH